MRQNRVAALRFCFKSHFILKVRHTIRNVLQAFPLAYDGDIKVTMAGRGTYCRQWLVRN